MNKIVMYSLPSCPGCDSMRRWLQEHNIPYTIKTVGEDITVNEFFDKFGEGKGVPAFTLNEEVVEQPGLLVEYGDSHGNRL